MDRHEDCSPIGEEWHEERRDAIGPLAHHHELEKLVAHIQEQDAFLRPRRGNRSAAVFEIGGALFEAKKLVPHRQFLNWIASQFPDWSERMAQNYMRVTRVLGHKAETVSGLTLRALLALSAETPQKKSIRDEILAALEEGVDLKSSDIERRMNSVPGGALTDPRLLKMQNARMAAALLRRQLPEKEMLELVTLLNSADNKAFVAAVLAPTTADQAACCGVVVSALSV